MKLLRETLTNFKGIRSFTFEPGGNSICIRGDNGTGKTTLLDGFLWVLFDKDSGGRKEFELKTLGADGETIPMLDHSVELIIEHKGETLVLKKTLSECWVKARGSANAEFSGHKTLYEINRIPLQKKEFDAKIAELFDESLLRMLTDPSYFPSKLPWQERRKELMRICDKPSVADVIAANQKLAGLSTILETRTIEEHRKVIAARKAMVNNEMKAIPVRVDEATRNLPESRDIDESKLQAELETARTALRGVETQLLQLSQGGAVVSKRLRLQTIETEALSHRNKVNAARQQTIRSKQQLYNADLNQKELLTRRVADTTEQIKEFEREAGRIQNQLEQKRTEWIELESTETVETANNNCPTCGQALPAEQVQAARDNAQEALSAAGLKLAETLAAIEKQRQQLEPSVPVIHAEIASLTKKLTAQQVDIESFENASGGESAEMKALQYEKAKVSADIETLQKTTEPERNRLHAVRENIQQNLATLEKTVAELEQGKTGKKRIEELKEREKTLAEEYEQLEQQTFQLEEFIRTQVNLLESKINNRFKVARFRLFEQQINGALNEICEVLGPDMVPYNSGLNNAARINTGIDIINTLAEHYGFTAPIFIDNAEAVTHLIDTPAEVIRLVVSETDKTMKVEE